MKKILLSLIIIIVIACSAFIYFENKSNDVPIIPIEKEQEIVDETQEDEEEIETVCDHQFDVILERKPTCLAKGLKVEKCQLCDFEVETTIDALGHDYHIVYDGKKPNYQLDCTNGDPKFKVDAICSRDNKHHGYVYVDAKYNIIQTPTTTSAGKISYTANYDNFDYVIEKNVAKAKSYDWTWAFQNDFNGDGIPELLPNTYKGKVKYTYRYKLNYDDLPGYPQVQDYGFTTDQQWDDAYLEDERLYNQFVVAAINNYGEGSQEYWQAVDDYNNAVNEIYDKLFAIDEAADLIYQADVKKYVDSHDCSAVGGFSNKKTYTVTENRNLCYWLHVPFDYDKNKSYPFVIFSPGEGGNINDYLNADGTVKGDSVIPYGADWCNAFFANWYNQVKQPGPSRDKYDCFMIIIYPTNSFFRGETLQGKGKAVGIVDMYNVKNIADAHKYTEEEMGGSYRYNYMSCYDSSLLQPPKDGQLCIQLIDKMMKKYNIDAKRQYILGASLGGIFTMDMISHYPNRFAAAVPVVTASADISEKNCKNLTNMNIWAISGSGDSNCSKFHSKLFVDSINAARAKYDPKNKHIAQYSFFPGGHSCGYIGSSTRKADQGVSITYATQVLDFMFDSKKD